MTTLRSRTSALLAGWRLILIVAALAAGLAFLMSQFVDEEQNAASVRVGLTSASVWPRYQADLESFANIVNREDIRAEVDDRVDGTILSVDTETVEGIFVVEVVVSADTTETAIDAAEHFAATGIEQHTADADGATADELAILSAELDKIDDQLVELTNTEIELREEARALASATDGEFSFEAEALYRTADAAASRSTAERNATEQRRRSVANQVDDLLLRADLSTERLFVVQDAKALEGSAPIGGPLLLIASALAGALSAGAWIIGRDRLSGPIQTAEQVERVLGFPVVAHLVDDEDTFDGKRLIKALRSVGASGTVELVVDDEVQADPEDLCDSFHELTDEQDVEDDIDRLGRFVVDPLDHADAAVIVIETGSSSVASVEEQARYLEMTDVRLIGIVLA